MLGVKRTAIIVADANHERLRTALVTACAQAALGDSVSVFLQGAAVGLLRNPIEDPDGPRQRAAGLPTLAQLFDEAAALGLAFAACQSSLTLLNASAANFDERIQWTGMIGFLSTIEPDDRLLIA